MNTKGIEEYIAKIEGDEDTEREMVLVGLVKELTEEVEKLRADITQQNVTDAEYLECKVASHQSRIDSLTKEVSSYKKTLEDMEVVAREQGSEIASLKAENAELIPLIQKNTALTNEVAELKQLNVVTRIAVNSRDSALEKADRAIADLKAQLSESQERVKELETKQEQRICSGCKNDLILCRCIYI